MFCYVGIKHQLNYHLNSPCSNEVAQQVAQNYYPNMSLWATIFGHCSLYSYTLLSKSWYMTTVSHSPTKLADLPDLHERKIHQCHRLWSGVRQADDRRKQITFSSSEKQLLTLFSLTQPLLPMCRK